MSTQPALHPTDQTLHAYDLGRLDDASAQALAFVARRLGVESVGLVPVGLRR